MEKWNPFKKNVLTPDKEEGLGDGKDGYGVPRDAATADALGVMPDHNPQDAAESSDSADSMNSGDSYTGYSSADAAGAVSYGTSTDSTSTDSTSDTGSFGTSAGSTTDASSFGTSADSSASDASGFGTSADSSASDASGFETSADSTSGTGSFGSYADSASGTSSFGSSADGASGTSGFGTSADSSAYDTSGFGSYADNSSGTGTSSDAAGAAGMGTAAGMGAAAGMSGAAGMGDGSGPAGSAGPGGPGGPAGPNGPHDFDVDEPKFDTQTGEPLDKPKKKFPAMILTLAVSAIAIGAFAYAVNPTALPSRKEEPAEDPVETDVALAIAADESEASVQDLTESMKADAAQTESEQTEAEQTQTELSSVQADVIAAASEETEPAEVIENSGLAIAGDAQIHESETETETETEAETESETETGTGSASQKTGETESGVPQFKTEGITVSASLDVSDMVEEVMPGIVSVTATSVQTVRDFFYGTKQFEQTDAGSGIIIEKDDKAVYIVTDAYILSNAQDVTVGFCVKKDQTEGLSDEDTFSPASVVGYDPETGLALLEVSLDDINETVRSIIKPAVLGDSDQIRVGERAIAIGNAMGYGLSVTQGIVSAVERQMQYGDYVFPFIQTDASINYGNYGGALLNEAGEVIGINAGKITDDSSEGMGYAFPINEAKEVILGMLPDGGSDASGQEENVLKPSQESASQKETQPQEETKKQLETLAIADDYDEEESQAAESEAGKEKSSEAAAETAPVKEEASSEKAGEEKEASSEKAGEEKEASSEKAGEEKEASSEKAGEKKETSSVQAAGETETSAKEEASSEKASEVISPAPTEESAGTEVTSEASSGEEETEDVQQTSSKGQLGIQVGEYNKEDQIIYRIPAGAVVASVMEGSAAEKAGLSEGDLICRIDDTEIGSVEDLQKALKDKKPGDQVEVSYYRPSEESGYDDSKTLSVTVTLQ